MSKELDWHFLISPTIIFVDLMDDISSLSCDLDDLQKRLNDLRKELKCWESMFYRSNGRKPTKDDIDGSGNEIKATYKKYSHVRNAINKQKQIDSQSHSHTENISQISSKNGKDQCLEDQSYRDSGDGVFGTKFNKTVNEKSNKQTHLKEHILSDRRKSLFRKRHLKLPFETNDFQENQQEKALGEQIEVKNESENALELPVESIGGKDLVDEDIGNNVKITSCNPNNLIQPRKLSKANSKSKYSLSRNYKISEQWLEKYNMVNEQLSNEKSFEFSGKNIEKESDLQTENNVPKDFSKTQYETSEEDLKCFEVIKNGNDANEHLKRMQDNYSTNKDKKEIVIRNGNDSKASKVEFCKNFGDVLMDKDSHLGSQLKETNATENLEAANFHSQEQTTSVAHNREKRERTDNMEQLRGATAHKQDFPRLSIAENRIPKIAPQKRKAEKICVDSLSEDLSVKTSDEKTASPVPAGGKKRKTDSSVAEKADSNIPRGKRLVSENFVRIDIQKKKFCRGKRRVKASTYKRQQWKKKTQFNSKSSASCFKCGQEGHWAKECAKKSFNGKQDRGSTFNGRNNEDYLPVDASNVKGDIGFSLEDVPDLPRCWPRVPYHPPQPSAAVPPLFDPIDNQPSKDAFDEVNSTLLTFGYNSFRYGQEATTARIVSGLSTLLVLSTGSGKSLCYQLPAFLYYKKGKFLTIVISPLVALMEDQVGNLPYGLKGACLHTNMTKQQREKVIRDLADRKFAILFLSPEALVSGSSATGYMPMLGCLPPIAFACIDEAHCVSEWSHNFRPKYLRVCKVLRQQLGVNCLLGLTATATKATSLSISRHLGIEETDFVSSIIRGTTMPDNLHLTVSRDADRDQALVHLLSSPRFNRCISIIIYCTRREETERLSSMLRTCLQNLPPTELDVENEEETLAKVKRKGRRKKSQKPKIKCVLWDAECYHAGMPPAQRKRVQKKFMSGELRIVVATTAFGMGLDKSDVRAIIHYNMPKSFESYLQEVGRAGRDGAPAYCHVFLDNDTKDLCELRRHTYSNSVDRKCVKQLVNKIFKSCDCKERSLNVNSSSSSSAIDGNRMNMLNIDQHNCYLDNLQLDDLGNLDEDSKSSGSVNNFKEAKKPSMSMQPNTDDTKMVDDASRRCCTGHHVTFSIESTVLDLDMPEENISTLLCYLELRPNSLIKLMNPIKSKCTVKCYGGPQQMKNLARKFMPLTAVFNQMKRNNLSLSDKKCITFDVVEVADDMSWDLDPVYRELRSIQWNTQFSLSDCDTHIGKSGVIVEFDDLSYHVISPGDLNDDERDFFTEILFNMTENQEETRLLQLDALYHALYDSSRDTCHALSSNHDQANDLPLRKSIQEYFDCDPSEMKSLLRSLCPEKINIHVAESIWNSVARDVRTMIGLHHDVTFTGRSLARIFHGIDSPCFPATVWGRDRRFWRRYLDIDFNDLRKYITAEMIRFRS